jgi:hypothetical protein
MNGNGFDPWANRGYAGAQLAKAFTTALTHEDDATRRRAEARIESWNKVLGGMSDGTLSIGSRTPVAGLPEWVTPEVVRGGFATGEAAAGGPLLPYEVEDILRVGVARERRALFLYYLTEAGQAELRDRLDSGRYEITLPEEGALLVVAWLLRAGEPWNALELLEAIGPFADRLRFTPRPRDGAPRTARDAEVVHRHSVGEVRGTLGRLRPKPAISAMNEALSVWNPFADKLLAHWLETVEDGRVGARMTREWRARGRHLLDEYEFLADNHTLCGKHRKPKENLCILRTALEDAAYGRSPSRMGLVQHAVDAMVRRRGAPGSPGHTALRERQAEIAARPTHHSVAQVLIARLSALPPDEGLASPDAVTGPVTEDEAHRTGIPAGTPIPPGMRATVESAMEAPVGTLVERGVVPSAEVLATLVPKLVAWTTAQSYQDESLRVLMAAVYQAFRNRRSLLLLNLESQVRLDELPWVRAVKHHRRDTADAGSRRVLVRLGELALQGFPGTILPNPLIRELDVLARSAGVPVPFVEELAADIFMGAFTRKFADAAKLAADLLEGTFYQRYYGIDYDAVRRISTGRSRRASAARGSDDFAAICFARAGVSPTGSFYYSVAHNGKVIEQSQILTTHNLAALVHPVGVDPSPGWSDLARRAFAHVCRLVGQLPGNPRPLGTVKDAAYAWRQMVFFLALCGLEHQIDAIAWMQEHHRRQPGHVVERLAPALAGLRHVLVGGTLDDGGAPIGARRFLGWTTRRHWMLDDRVLAGHVG